MPCIIIMLTALNGSVRHFAALLCSCKVVLRLLWGALPGWARVAQRAPCLTSGDAQN